MSRTSLPDLQEGLYEVNGDDTISSTGYICKAQNSKLLHSSVGNPVSSQTTPTANRQEVQDKPQEYKFSSCLKTYKSASEHDNDVKSKHSSTLHCDQCTWALLIIVSQMFTRRKRPSRRNGYTLTKIAHDHLLQKGTWNNQE